MRLHRRGPSRPPGCVPHILSVGAGRACNRVGLVDQFAVEYVLGSITWRSSTHVCDRARTGLRLDGALRGDEALRRDGTGLYFNFASDLVPQIETSQN